jgi:hypothetical protein
MFQIFCLDLEETEKEQEYANVEKLWLNILNSEDKELTEFKIKSMLIESEP